jgi:hypothetical protein
MSLPGAVVPDCVVMLAFMGGEALIAYFDVKDELGGVLGSGMKNCARSWRLEVRNEAGTDRDGLDRWQAVDGFRRRR